MKGGSVTDSPSNVGIPRLCAGVPLVVHPVALLNGGSGGLCVVPVFGLGSPLHIILVPFALSCPLVYCCALFFPPSTACVLCHSIVGLVLCLCDRVVSLWNSGNGLCGLEGRVVFTVYTSSVL